MPSGRHDVVTLPDAIRLVKGRQPAFWRAIKRWLNFGHRRVAHRGLAQMKLQFFRCEHHRSAQKIAKFGFGLDRCAANFAPLLSVERVVALGVGTAVEGANHPREAPHGLGKQSQVRAGLHHAAAHGRQRHRLERRVYHCEGNAEIPVGERPLRRQTQRHVADGGQVQQMQA